MHFFIYLIDNLINPISAILIFHFLYFWSHANSLDVLLSSRVPKLCPFCEYIVNIYFWSIIYCYYANIFLLSCWSVVFIKHGFWDVLSVGLRFSMSWPLDPLKKISLRSYLTYFHWMKWRHLCGILNWLINVYTKMKMNEWMNEWVSEWVSEWISEWMNE